MVVDDILAIGMTRTEFIMRMAEEGIHVLFRQNDAGRVYGITYVDNVGRCVFNGSDLAQKRYAAATILQRLAGDHPIAMQNKKLVSDALKKVPYASGIKAVLHGWLTQGVVVAATRAADGNVYYKMGHARTGQEHYWPLDERTSSYLQVNGYTSSRSTALNAAITKHIKSASGDAFRPLLEDAALVMTGIAVQQMHQLLEAIFSMPPDDHDYISPELLREARRKKKNRRKS